MTPLGGPLWELGEWTGNAVDDLGVEWWVESEDGWSSSPAIRADSGDLPGGDGAFDSNPLYSGRVITLAGSAIAPSSELANAARLRFSSLLEANRGGVLRVTEDGLALSAVVRPSGAVKVERTGGYAFAWQLILVAADPRKYGDAIETSTGMAGSTGGLVFPVVFPADFGASAGGSVSLVNHGTVKSWPVIRITGPVVNPRVQNPSTGDELVLAMTIDAGEYVDIDTSARTVLLQGTASRRARVSTSGEWLPIAPGGTSFSFGADFYSLSASLTVSARSAWI